MRTRICCLVFVVVACAARTVSAQTWDNRQTLQAITESTQRIQFMTADPSRTTPTSRIEDVAPQAPAGPALTQPEDVATNEVNLDGEPAGDFGQDDCNCDCGCVDSCPRSCWTVWAGAIFLKRSSSTVSVLSAEDNSTVLDPLRYNFGTQGGVDLNAIRHGDRLDVDFRYFQVSQMQAAHTITPSQDVLSFGVFDVANDTVATNYFSSLQSVESNLRRNVTENITLLAGLRYLSLREDLGANFDLTDDSVGPIGVHLNTVNRLFGVQVGAAATLLTYNRFELQTVAKVGLYGNRATSALRVTGADTFDASLSASHNQAAFVGDWNFTGIYHFNDRWALRAGYQLLWLSGVALAGQQFNAIDSSSNLPQLSANTSGHIFLNGALVSLQCSW